MSSYLFNRTAFFTCFEKCSKTISPQCHICMLYVECCKAIGLFIFNLINQWYKERHQLGLFLFPLSTDDVMCCRTINVYTTPCTTTRNHRRHATCMYVYAMMSPYRRPFNISCFFFHGGRPIHEKRESLHYANISRYTASSFH